MREAAATIDMFFLTAAKPDLRAENVPSCEELVYSSKDSGKSQVSTDIESQVGYQDRLDSWPPHFYYALLYGRPTNSLDENVGMHEVFQKHHG